MWLFGQACFCRSGSLGMDRAHTVCVVICKNPPSLTSIRFVVRLSVVCVAALQDGRECLGRRGACNFVRAISSLVLALSLDR